MVENLATNCKNVEKYEGRQLIVGIAEEMLMLESTNSLIKLILDRSMKYLNKSCFELIDVKDHFFQGNIDQNLYIPEVDFVLLALDHASYGALKYYVNSAWITNADSIIVSRIPDKYEASLDSLQCQEMVRYATLSVVISLAFLLTFISLVFKNSKIEVATKTKSFGQLYFNQLWNITRSIMSQGVSRIPRYLPSRIVWAHWLICFLIAKTFLTSFFQSNLSVIEYDTIDSISDLLDETKNRPLPVMMKNVNEHVVLIKKALFDPLSEQLLSKMKGNSMSLIDANTLLEQSFFNDISDGKKALIIQRIFWIAGFELLLQYENNFYQYGHASISSGMLTGLYNRSFPRDLQEKLNNLLLNFADGYCIHSFIHENKYLIDKFSWHPEIDEDFDPMSIKDIRVYFSIALISLTIKFVILLMEVMIYAIKVETTI